MKRLTNLFLTLLLVPASAMAAGEVKMSVTMNTLATKVDVVPLDNQAKPELTEEKTRQFDFQAVPGTRYKLMTYNADSKWLGSVTVRASYDEAENALAVFNPSAKVKNSGWTAGTDCTFSVSLTEKSGSERAVEPSMELGYATFPAVKGDNFTVTATPSEARMSEGYLSTFMTGSVTFNRTLNMTVPMGREYALTVPEGAKVTVAEKILSYAPFREIAPAKVTGNADGTATYAYTLAEKQVYNYRVKYTDTQGVEYVTVASKFTMVAENTAKEITAAEIQGYGSPRQTVADPAANNGSNVADVYLTADYRGTITMKSGEKRLLKAMRNWQITDNVTNNYFLEPDFHFNVIGTDGQPSQKVVTVDENGLITAVGKGTAIVLVTYDALHADGQLGGPLFGAIDPENTGVAVVTVDAPMPAIMPNTLLNATLNAGQTGHKLCGINLDAELDVLYFTGESAEYTFKPEGVKEVLVASPTFSGGAAAYSGFSASGVTKNADGSYTLGLTSGRNIVMLRGEDNTETYQVIRARKCTAAVTNLTREGEAPRPGDEVSVLLDGVYHPANKLAAVYNLNAAVHYSTPQGEAVNGKPNQYKFASDAAARTVTVTIPEDWDASRDFTLSDGAVSCNYFSDVPGSHRLIDFEHGRAANFNAVMCPVYLGSLPDITLYTAGSADGEAVVLDFEDASFKGDIANIAYRTPTMTAETYWSSLIDNAQYGGPLLYPETAPATLYGWYDEGNTNLRSSLNTGDGTGKFWNGGTAVSNYTADSYANADYTAQLEAYTPEGGKGGFGGSDNFLVAFGYNETSTSWGTDTRPVLEFNAADGEPLYAYVNLGTYGIRAALTGDEYNPAATDTDWVDVTAEGLDADGQPISGSQAKFRLVAPGKKVTTEWTKWDLSALGKCRKVRFNIESSMIGAYGMSFPGCFLLDNIAVKPGSGVSGIESVTADRTLTSPADNAIYDLSGRRLQRIPGPGFYIVGGKKVMVK